jgi:hypothetical protein
MVHGQPFDHHDQNTLAKVAEPEPNPLARLLAARAASEPITVV